MTEPQTRSEQGVISAIDGASGTVDTTSGPVRFGVATCIGFDPVIGLHVRVEGIRDFPTLGARAALVVPLHDDGPCSIEGRVAAETQRQRAVERLPYRIEDAERWLTDDPDHHVRADRFGESGAGLEMVRRLQSAGAARVALLGRGSTPPDRMEIEVPDDSDAREAILTVLRAEFKELGEDFAVGSVAGSGTRALLRQPPPGVLVWELWWD